MRRMANVYDNPAIDPVRAAAGHGRIGDETQLARARCNSQRCRASSNRIAGCSQPGGTRSAPRPCWHSCARGMKIQYLRWYIAGLLFTSTVINYIDRQTLSIVAPLLTKELQISPIDYSNIL